MNSDIKKVLFIGGSKDGEWIKVDTTMQYIKVPVLDNTKYIDSHSLEYDVVTTELYRSEFIRAQDKEFQVYVMKNLTLDQMCNMLIEGYKKSENKRII